MIDKIKEQFINNLKNKKYIECKKNLDEYKYLSKEKDMYVYLFSFFCFVCDFQQAKLFFLQIIKEDVTYEYDMLQKLVYIAKDMQYCDEILELYYCLIKRTNKQIGIMEIGDSLIDGKDYFFVNDEEFIRNIENNNFIEYAKVYDKYYGTPKNEVLNRLKSGKDVILVIDITGALNIKKSFKDAIFIFIMPPDLKTLLERVVSRNRDSKDKMLKRFKEDYKLVNEYNKYNYVVVNDNLNDAVKKIESILIASKCSAQRIEDLELDNDEEIIHEYLMD